MNRQTLRLLVLTSLISALAGYLLAVQRPLHPTIRPSDRAQAAEARRRADSLRATERWRNHHHA